MIILAEFLSNSMIKNGQVLLEAKQREVKDDEKVHQVIVTKITAQQHEKLSSLIYNQHNLLELVHFKIVSRLGSAHSSF